MGALTPEEANGCLWSLMHGAEACQRIRQIKRADGKSLDTAKRPSGIPERMYQFVLPGIFNWTVAPHDMFGAHFWMMEAPTAGR